MVELAGYRLGATLHREEGGSAVLRATRLSDGLSVVIKTFAADFPRPDGVARLEHEYALGRELGLPSVLGYLDIVRSGARVALVLEDFAARSLDELRGEGPLSIGAFLKVARPLAAALAELHRAGVVHNDICPANALVTADLTRLKLADLGSATRLLRTEQQAYRPELLEGTLAYMSPERTGRMNRAVDHRGDLYSLGATFYALLAGAPPFTAPDAMGMIHAHIARAPQPLTEVRADVPPALSAIVDTLLAKTPEDRYQSAEGLLSDLERLAALFEATGAVPEFPLRSDDRQLHFAVSEKLYGRDDEVRRLLETFERASVGALELVVLRGLPGIGKSVLVHEVHKPIVARRGTYAAGKFDQLAQATPLSGVTQVLRGLLAPLLAESAERLAAWQEAVLATTGPEIAAVVELLPEAMPLFGHLPRVLDLGPSQNRERFDRVLWALVQSFASAEHPLVLFFDDVQWIDPASLRFLTGLAVSPESRHTLLLFALRSSEVDANHPVSLALEKIAHAGTPSHELALGPLGVEELVTMVSDSLGRIPADVRELAVSLHQKTGGNPFFVTQFLKSLVDDGLLRYEREARQWGWDMAAILRLEVVGDVAPLMSGKVARYTPGTRDALALASVLGTTFDLDTLAILHGQSPRETAKALWAPLQDGLLLPLDAGFHYAHVSDDAVGGVGTGVRYKFAHDRIQEACHSFIPPDRARETSLRIARTLESRLPKEQRGDRLFDIASHFKAAGALLTDPEERRRVAELHLEAARRAKAATAYATALSHALAGIALFDADAWTTDYARMYDLHKERIDCEFLAGNVERAEAAYDAVAPHAVGAIDKAEIAQLLIRIYLTADRPADGLRIGRESLSMVDIDLPADPAAAGVAMAEERQKIAVLLGDGRVPDLIHHRRMDDRSMETRLGLLHETWTCGVMTGDFQEVAHTALKIVRLSLEHGNCKFSACGYVAHAAVLCATGDYANAKDYGELSVALARQFADVFIIPKVHNTFANFTNHWVNHVRSNVGIYEESYAACRQSGDRWWGAWAVGWIRTAQLIGGVRLDEVLTTADKYHPYIEASGYTPLVWMSVLDRQILRCLLGRTESATSFSSEGMPEESIEKAFTDMGFGFGLFLYNNYKSLAAWLAGDAEQAAAFSRKAESTKDHIPGLMPYPDFFLYNTLAFAARAPEAPPEERAELLRAIDANIERMTVWAGVCPENFEHRLLLMRAERARLAEDDAEAASLYERAIEVASRTGYLQNEAIANECAGRHHLAKRRERASRGYFTEAAYLYERWGAFPKVARLKKGEASAAARASTLAAEVGRTARIGQDTLDLSTVMAAAGALSRELRQDRLLSQLLTLSMRHAGAERGFFLVEEGGRTRVAAALAVGGELALGGGQPVEQRDDLALSVVRYVERTGETLAIDDAASDPRFARDVYVLRRRAKSILCLPVLRQGVRAGVLYLENGLTAGAFTAGHVRLLELLAAQAAISIENAALYDTLEQKVALRTRELAEKNDELVHKNAEILRTQGQLVQSEKMASLGQLVAGVAHEINNPINFIASGLPSLRRDIDKVAEMVPAPARDATYDKLRARLGKLLMAIQEGAQRTGEIVKNLRSFSRLDEAAQKAADLHEGLDSTLVLLGSKLRDGIVVEKRYGALPLVECYPSQLNQVFMNLLVNALQAMDERGTLTLETRRVGDDQVELSVRDSGKGIPEEVRAKIFDPFFTTKPVGEGTGLGLSISHEIVAKHQGRIEVESELGRGTTFRITLPIRAARPREV